MGTRPYAHRHANGLYNITSAWARFVHGFVAVGA
jgi:hypothetical protein